MAKRIICPYCKTHNSIQSPMSFDDVTTRMCRSCGGIWDPGKKIPKRPFFVKKWKHKWKSSDNFL